jgi:AraC-like DNA-binding protein
MNISEIAYEVGFQQVAYFRKCFKELYKMTPSEYIKKNSTPISNWKETGWRNGVRE